MENDKPKNKAAVALGRLGGKVKGQTKRRNVDYAELAKLSWKKRRDKQNERTE